MLYYVGKRASMMKRERPMINLWEWSEISHSGFPGPPSPPVITPCILALAFHGGPACISFPQIPRMRYSQLGLLYVRVCGNNDTRVQCWLPAASRGTERPSSINSGRPLSLVSLGESLRLLLTTQERQ